MTLLAETCLAGIAVGAVYGLVALGFVLIFKSSGVLNIAQGALVMCGAFICYALAGQAKLPFWLAVVLTAVLAMLFGALIERVFLRRMVGQPLLGVIMMTIALLSILVGLAQTIYGSDFYSYPPYLPSEPLHLGGITFSWVYFLAVVASAILLPVFAIFFKRHRMGIAMRATADDQQAAQSLGIRVESVYSAAWALSCLTAAIGGIVLGTITGVFYGLDFVGLKVFPAVVVGGLDSIAGGVIGGIIVGVLENLAGSYLDPILAGFKETFPFIILLLVLILRPYGIFGLERIERI